MSDEVFSKLELRLDETWMFVCTALVIFMQAGFGCYEAGLARSKNSIGVAINNIIDFCVAAVLFWAFGYGLLFGNSQYRPFRSIANQLKTVKSDRATSSWGISTHTSRQLLQARPGSAPGR